MNSTIKWASAALTFILIAGCSKNPATEPSDAPAVNASSEGPSGSAGIAPMTTAPIASAPISGSETLQGGGSGVGQAMKNKAKGMAGGPSSSMDSQPPDDEDGG
ncbi:MAG: hypothetical protein WAO58_09705 [Fimbriimonadaceae bacterium]